MYHDSHNQLSFQTSPPNFSVNVSLVVCSVHFLFYFIYVLTDCRSLPSEKSRNNKVSEETVVEKFHPPVNESIWEENSQAQPQERVRSPIPSHQEIS